MKLRNKKTREIEAVQHNVALLHFSSGKTSSYHSLAELNEEWEDYTPQEPLIKDEKTRKAVRVWAEVNSIVEALYAERSDRRLCILTDMGEGDYNIEFVGWIPTLKDGESYSIAELCGEEEE